MQPRWLQESTVQSLTITFHKHTGRPYRERLDTNHSKLLILHLSTAYAAFSLLTTRHLMAKLKKGGKKMHFMAELRLASIFKSSLKREVLPAWRPPMIRLGSPSHTCFCNTTASRGRIQLIVLVWLLKHKSNSCVSDHRDYSPFPQHQSLAGITKLMISKFPARSFLKTTIIPSAYVSAGSSLKACVFKKRGLIKKHF